MPPAAHVPLPHRPAIVAPFRSSPALAFGRACLFPAGLPCPCPALPCRHRPDTPLPPNTTTTTPAALSCIVRFKAGTVLSTRKVEVGTAPCECGLQRSAGHGRAGQGSRSAPPLWVGQGVMRLLARPRHARALSMHAQHGSWRHVAGTGSTCAAARQLPGAAAAWGRRGRGGLGGEGSSSSAGSAGTKIDGSPRRMGGVGQRPAASHGCM